MEKILERFGLYDIWTVLFPGMVLNSGLRTLNDYMLKIIQSENDLDDYGVGFERLKLYYPTDIYSLIAFIIVSYLCGLVLHELGSMSKRIIYRKGKPTELLLEKENLILNFQQLQIYTPIFLKLNKNKELSKECFEKRKEESRNIFNIMNTELQLNGISVQYIKLNLIYNMCLTLCVAILLMLAYIFIFILWGYIQKKDIYLWGFWKLATALMAACWILYSRSKRYYIYWVRNIVIAYGNFSRKDT